MKYNTVLGHPSNDRLLVAIIKPPEKTAGGLFLAESVKENVEKRCGRGTILDAGLAARDTMRDYQWDIGDEVTFGKFSPVYMGGEEWGDSDRRGDEGFVLNIGDILTNVSLAKRLAAKESEVVYDAATKQHMIRKINSKNGEPHAAAAV
jgi:co-chaperonin GroES (HSP10)